MPMIIKLTVFSVLNMMGLIWFLSALVKSGQTPAEALAIAWHMIMGGYRKKELKGVVFPDGAVILGKIWWLMLGLHLFCWITQPGTAFFYWGLILLILHLVWFWLSQTGEDCKSDRIIELNSQWGMVFLAVRPDSCIAAKTLAELDLRKKNLLVLAIERQNQTIPFPKGFEVLLPGDRLVMFGDLNYYRGLNF